MKTFKYALMAAALMALAAACHKYEMKPYGEAPAINFIGSNANGSDSDDAKTLAAETNFGITLPIPDSTNVDTLNVKVRLLGKLQDTPLNIVLKVEKDGDEPMPDLVLLNPYVMPDSAYRMTLKVVVNRPAERHVTYKAKLVVDYALSDVQAGVSELQEYGITVRDELTREMIGVSEADWADLYEAKIGPYSENKARFMVMEFDRVDLGNLMYFGPYPAHVARLQAALEKYNQMYPDNPLKDENGNPIKFEPA